MTKKVESKVENDEAKKPVETKTDEAPKSAESAKPVEPKTAAPAVEEKKAVPTEDKAPEAAPVSETPKSNKTWLWLCGCGGCGCLVLVLIAAWWAISFFGGFGGISAMIHGG
jgi:hypothetical protein